MGRGKNKKKAQAKPKVATKKPLTADELPDAEVSGERSGWSVAAASVALFALALVLYWPATSYGTISFDDPAYVTDNPAVLGGFSSGGLRWAFSADHSNNWHPLSWLSHMADVEMFGLDFGAHHRTSLFLHGIAAVLLFLWLVQSLSLPSSPAGDRARAWSLSLSLFVAAWFVVHPLNVESVVWLSERKSSLSAVFFFAILLVWTERSRRLDAGRSGVGLYFLSLGLLVAGLLSKPMLVTVPFVLLLLDLWPLGRWRSWPGPLTSEQGLENAQELTRPSPGRSLVIEKIPFFIGSLVSIGLTLRAQSGLVQDLESFPLGDRVSNAVASYGRYVIDIFAPRDLAVLYPFSSVAPGVALVLVVLLVGLLGVVFKLRHRHPVLLFGALWYLGLLIPVIGVVQVGLQGRADRYAYLPMVGLVLALTVLLVQILGARFRFALLIAGVLALALLGYRTRQQIPVWQDDLALYSHAAQVTEDNFWANYNLGLIRIATGDPGAALEAFREARRIEPDNVPTLLNLGDLMSMRGQGEEAIRLYARAVELDPLDRVAVQDLSRSLLQRGRNQEAQQLLEEALETHPDDPELWLQLGTSRIQQGKLEEAEAPLRRSIELDPNNAVSQNALGVSLAQRGLYQEAIPHFERTIDLDPSRDEAKNNLEAARELSGVPEGPIR